jgi:hypothetical protein
MTVVVRRRYGQEWVDVRDFVRPYDYMVRRQVAAIGRGRRPSIKDLWDWQIRNIRYPWGPAGVADGHLEMRFPLPLPRYIQWQGDWWGYPSETLRDRTGDCDDSTALLASMLRCAGYDAWFTVGWWVHGDSYLGHTWVSLPREGRWQVLETTLLRPLPDGVVVWEGGPYVPAFRFTDTQVSVIRSPDIPPRVQPYFKRGAINAAYRLVG